MKIFKSILKKTVESALKRDANSTTCIVYYQPKAPEVLKKYSKVEK